MTKWNEQLITDEEYKTEPDFYYPSPDEVKDFEWYTSKDKETSKRDKQIFKKIIKQLKRKI